MPSGASLSPFPASSAARLSSASSAWFSGSSSERPLPARTSTPPLAPSPFTRHSALLLPRPAVAPNGRGGGRRGNGRVVCGRVKRGGDGSADGPAAGAGAGSSGGSGGADSGGGGGGGSDGGNSTGGGGNNDGSSGGGGRSGRSSGSGGSKPSPPPESLNGSASPALPLTPPPPRQSSPGPSSRSPRPPAASDPSRRGAAASSVPQSPAAAAPPTPTPPLAATRRRRRRERGVGWRRVAWALAAALLWGGGAYAQQRARQYVQARVLPVVEAAASAQAGRQVALGRVQQLLPWAVSVGPVSIGPAASEFSCAHADAVQVRPLFSINPVPPPFASPFSTLLALAARVWVQLHPVASVAQGRVVVGAQVQRATVLVAQQPDWTWLGIPADMDAPTSPSSSIPPLSARASLQRQARDAASVAAAEERDRLALRGAQIEYRGEGGAQGLGGRGGEGEAGAKGEGRVVGGAEVGGGKARVEWEWMEEQQRAAERAVSNVLRAAVVALGWHGYDQHPLSATAPAPSAPPSTPSVPPTHPLSAQEQLLSLSASATLAHLSSLPPHLMPPPRPPPAPAPMPTQHKGASGSEGGGGRGLSGEGMVGGERMARESGKGREGHMVGDEGRLGHMESGGLSVGANGDGLSRRGGDGSMSTEGTVAAVGGRESDARESEARSVVASSAAGGGRGGEGGRSAGEGEGSESALRDALALAIRQRMAAHVGGGLVEGQVAGQVGGQVGGRGERIGVGVEQEAGVRGSGTREVVEAQGAWGGAARREEATDRGLAPFTADAATGRAADPPLASGLPSPVQQQQAQAQQHSGPAPSPVSVADSQQWQQEQRQRQAEVAVQVERAPQSAAEPLPSPARMSKAGLPAPVCAREWALRKLHPAHGRGGPEVLGARGDGSEVGEKGTHGSAGRGAREAGEGVTVSQTAAVGGEEGAGGGRQGEEAAGGGGGRLVPCMEGVRVHGGTLMLLAYGDQEPRVVEHIDAHVTFPALPHSYKRIKVDAHGSLRPPRNFPPAPSPTTPSSTTTASSSSSSSSPQPPGSSGKSNRFSTPFHMMPGSAAAGRKEAEGGAGEAGGGLLRVAVDVDEEKHEWAVTVTAHNLFAPVMERLLEIPLDWYGGRADGQVQLWMGAGDSFPNFKGRVDIRDLAFQIWESPCAFTGVSGAVVLEGQRLFLHGVEGRYGHVPLRASGDMDLNQGAGGQYRITAQVQPVEANLLMKTLNAKPLPYPLAGSLQGLLFCRGPLDAPIFEGTAELAAVSADVDAAVAAVAGSDAAGAVEAWRGEGAVGAYDRVPVTAATANFTFNTDDCVSDARGMGALRMLHVAELHGVRAVPVGGGEIRGAGTLWVCPQAEADPSAVSVDCWAAGVSLDRLLAFYLPPTTAAPPSLLGLASGEAAFRGSLLSPTVEAAWKAPQARGPLEGMRGSVALTRDTAHAATHAHALDLLLSASVSAPPPCPTPPRPPRGAARPWPVLSRELPPLPPRPRVERVEAEARLRAFDALALLPAAPVPVPPPQPSLRHLRLSGRFKLSARVPWGSEGQPGEVDEAGGSGGARQEAEAGLPGLEGSVLIQGLKLNQLLLGANLSGGVAVSPHGFNLHTVGRGDEQLMLQLSANGVLPAVPTIPHASSSYMPQAQASEAAFPLFDVGAAAPAAGSAGGGLGGVAGGAVRVQRGQMSVEGHVRVGATAALEVRALPLDELELASLRGLVERAAVRLNFAKRRGHGSLAVRRPRFSGMLCDALHAAFRWTGDVVTLERSVLEQANSRYEVQGEYVLPGMREWDRERDRDRTTSSYSAPAPTPDAAATAAAAASERGLDTEWSGGGRQRAMPGQLQAMMTSIGRWRLRLDVPHADVSEMLPGLRILSRSHDPAVLLRSKELFLHGIEEVGFASHSLQHQLEKREREWEPAGTDVGGGVAAEALPGLVDLRGRWHGVLEASGGGNGDTSASFDVHGSDWEAGRYRLQQLQARGRYSNTGGLQVERLLLQKDDGATVHADGTIFGPAPSLHFALLNFPAHLVPTFLQALHAAAPSQSSAAAAASGAPFPPPPPVGVQQAAVRGVVHVEGDLSGSFAQPQCDVQLRLLDGEIAGVALGRAEVAASLTRASRLLFHAVLEPAVEAGQVRIKGNVPLPPLQGGHAGQAAQAGQEVQGAGRDMGGGGRMAASGGVRVQEKRRGKAGEKKQKAGVEPTQKKEGGGAARESSRLWHDWDWLDKEGGLWSDGTGSGDGGEAEEKVEEEEEEEDEEEEEGEGEGEGVQKGPELLRSLVELERAFEGEEQAEQMQVEASVQDAGMMLLTALSPSFRWIHGHAAISAQVGAAISAQVGAAISAQVGAAISAQVGAAISAQVGAAISAQVGAAISAQVGAAISAQVGAAISAQVGAAISAQVGAAIPAQHPCLFPNAPLSPLPVLSVPRLSLPCPFLPRLSPTALCGRQVSGTLARPEVAAEAVFSRVTASSPVLPRPLTGGGGRIRIAAQQLLVDGLEGRVGRRGTLRVEGSLPLGLPAHERGVEGAEGEGEETLGGLRRGSKGKRGSGREEGEHAQDSKGGEGINITAEGLEVRARNVFSGLVDAGVSVMGSLAAPEVTGAIRLSRGIAYLSQEKDRADTPPSPSVPSSLLPSHRRKTPALSAAPSSAPPAKSAAPDWLPAMSSTASSSAMKLPTSAPQQESTSSPLSATAATAASAATTTVPPVPLPAPPDLASAPSAPAALVRLRGLQVALGPELRVVYPLILNLATRGDLHLNGFADPRLVRPSGTLFFENGEVNLVATQLRLNRDHPNCARFEAALGMDPLLDLKLVGADWQMRIQGPANRWQDHVVLTTLPRGGEEDVLSPAEAARLFESQLAESLLEKDGQLALKKLAAATVETLMPKIESRGQFGQARWRLVSAPQIPNLLSLDPTSDPFQSLANLSFGAEVEIQIGNNLQASVVRQLRESEMATQWKLLYQLNSRLRLLFSSLSSVEKRLLFEYSASSQN
ncbi:unnamed protein product [Closterium sp. NIES-53]